MGVVQVIHGFCGFCGFFRKSVKGSARFKNGPGQLEFRLWEIRFGLEQIKGSKRSGKRPSARVQETGGRTLPGKALFLRARGRSRAAE
jgi:hypothetical protein